MSVLLDARPVSAAVIAAVSNAIAATAYPDQLAYERSSVPGTNRVDGTVPSLFAQVDVERRFDESAVRFSGPAGSTAWRVTVGAVSSPSRDLGASIREAEWVLAKTMSALEDVALTTTDGHEFRCRFETYRAPEYDDESYWGSVAFTCAT